MIDSKELIQFTENLTILLVEDDVELRTTMEEVLNNFFVNVDVAKDGKEALESYEAFYKTRAKYYDIVLTDIRMPKINGVDLTKNIYDKNSSQIVIVLSAHDESEYLLPLINLGIEQFIKKPIDFQELLEVLYYTSKSICDKRNLDAQQEQMIVEFGDGVVYDKTTHSLVSEGEVVYLTKYEILLLQLLTKSVGKIYSNENIVEYYHENNENIDAQNIRKLVSKIRKKLPKNSLESVYAIGYRLLKKL
jgi:DNA-binding response OmpR family regulator